MKKLNLKLVLLGLLFIGHIASAQNTRIVVRRMEMVNDCKDIMVAFSVDGNDTITINDVKFVVDGKPMNVVLSGEMEKCFNNGVSKKVFGRVSENGSLLAWKPTNVEITYTTGNAVARSYYSTKQLRYKKPIEERKSYLSITEGSMMLMGHNNTEYANALSGAPWAIYADLEFGKKILKNTFLTICSSGQELVSSGLLNSLMVGLKYEKSIGRKFVFGQIRSGYCTSSLYYRPVGDLSYSNKDDNYYDATSIIYGAQIGVGYSLSKTIRLVVKSNFLHTNVTINDIPQSITGIGLDGGISFYFNNRKI